MSVNALEDVDSLLLRHVTAEFGEEGHEFRLGRRKRNWIADVKYAEAA